MTDSASTPPETPPPPAPAGRKLVSDTSKLTGAVACSYGINLIGGLVIARILAPRLYGIWKTVQLAMQYSAFGYLGTSQGIDRLGPSLVSERKNERYQELVSNSLGFSFVLPILGAAALVLAALITQGGPVRSGCLALAMLILVQPLNGHAESILGVEKRFGARAIAMLGSTTARVVISIGAALLFGLEGVLVTFVVVLALTAVYMWRQSQLRLHVQFHWSIFRQLFAIGLPMTLLVVGEQVLITADKWVVAGVLGAKEMGLYQMAIFAQPILMLGPFSLRQVISIDIYDKFGRTGTLESVRAVYERSIMAIALGSPIVIGAVYYGVPWLISWLLDDYVSAIGAVRDFAVLIYPILLIQTAFAILIVAKKEKIAFMALIATAGACTCFSLAATHAGAGFQQVLWIHSVGWFLLSGGILFAVQRLFGDGVLWTLWRLLRWLLPMAFLAIELPAVSWLMTRIGLELNTFPHAALCGVVHTIACLPMLYGLERRTKAVSHALGKIRQRLGV
ncbi:oligosaccharide flippase family protein [bacterium]|nr:oligosaccharide flippase family protein [bacterium]